MLKGYTELFPHIYAMNHSYLKVLELLQKENAKILLVMKKLEEQVSVTKIL